MGEPFMRGIVRSVCSFVLFLTFKSHQNRIKIAFSGLETSG